MARAVVDVRDVACLSVQLLHQANIVEAGDCRSFIASTPGVWELLPSTEAAVLSLQYPDHTHVKSKP
ncbi:NAD(P)-binding protein [Penicillium concentricum]|uniref:NAD(P)-binding protein n=1 Tax=Penicillium concentricum TaxID=293559 RepID=A0A9W9SVE7_9EURO|nr:NAD(P)-binding protein [Penicillium concentricum]KAJ5384494.1 NAD(P)-binding protein [Penicillium concentricum]